MTGRRRLVAAAAAAATLALPAPAAAAPELVKVGDFSAPVYATGPASDPGALFVVLKDGRIAVVRNGTELAAPFLDIGAELASGAEQGLLGMAFAPDYVTSGLFYVYLTASEPAGELQVREYRRSADPNRADPSSARVVWRQDHSQNENHNGGTVQFGPDGRLWLATGDGGSQGDPPNNAQTLSSQLGKLLRIDPAPGNAGSYTIPADNPFGTAVWASGLRNPFRFSFDRGTGDLVIGDVGGSAREEVDYVRFQDGLGRGADFGWSCKEGTQPGPRSCTPRSPYLPPVFEYERSSPRSITGGVVVGDPGLPTLLGRYLYADAYGGEIRSLQLGLPFASDDRPAGLPQRDVLTAFGEDGCGRVHVVSLTRGTVERIQDGAPGACVPPFSAPQAPGPGAPAPEATDRTPPRLTVSVPRRQRALRRRAVIARVGCDERCRLVASARIRGAGRARSVRTTLEPGRSVGVRLRLTRRGLRAARRGLERRSSLRARIDLSATDAAGNLTRRARALRVRR